MEITLFIGRLILTGVLYLFLAAVFVVLWQDLRKAAHNNAPPAQDVNSRLVVIEGNADLPSGTNLPLQPCTTIGRGPANAIVLPDTFASAEHAIIALRDGRWWLEDRDSRNGTTLNGVQIESPIVLSADDVIGIGQVKLRVASLSWQPEQNKGE